MNIKTKYSVGDKVNVLADKILRSECPFCDGKGFRMIGKSKCYCQNCEDGFVELRDIRHQVQTVGEITSVRFDCEKAQEYDEYDKVENGCGSRLEYYVETPDKDVWGYGTYSEKQIISFAKKDEK